MNRFRLILQLLLLSALTVFTVSCTQESSPTASALTQEDVDFRGNPKTAGPTIVDLALAEPELSILVQALTRPDLETDFVDLLNGPRSFTVVAPTNQAFINLLNADPEWNSLDDIPADVLESVLKYHISRRPNATSDKLAKGTSIPTLLNPEKWFARPAQGTLEIVGNSSRALVLIPDIEASNGYVHVIDTVLLP